MIWFTLALFAVSFVITALLAPKPEFENARPESLDPNNFPQATEDDPVALVLGCVRIKGPNTLYYGDFESVPIVEKIKTGLFSSERVTVGFEYFLTLDLGICLGPDIILKSIYIDDVLVADGVIPDPTQYSGGYSQGYLPITTSPNFSYQTINLQEAFLDEFGDPTVDVSEIQDIVSNEEVLLQLNLDFTAERSDVFPELAEVWKVKIICYPEENGGGVAINPADDRFTITKTTWGGDTFDIREFLPAGTLSIQVGVVLNPSWPVFTSLTVTKSSLSISPKLDTVDPVSFDIVEPELYGGYKSGGGHVGNVTFYPGNFDQEIDPAIEYSVGRGEDDPTGRIIQRESDYGFLEVVNRIFDVALPPEFSDPEDPLPLETFDYSGIEVIRGRVPAYIGMAHIVMPNHNVGETPQLRKIEFEVAKYPNSLGIPGNNRAFYGSPDINPAEAIYFLATNGWSGLGTSPDNYDRDSFVEVAAILREEQNGVSIKVATPREGNSIITEILRQIDGVLVPDNNGKIRLKLIRNDYNVNDLDIFDEDDIVKIVNYSKTAWQDVKSEVKVSYAARDADGTKVAVAQNMATLNMIGRINRSEISFPFCYDAELANKLAARELAQLSSPLLSMTIRMNRSGFKLRVGDVFKINWAEFGISEVVMRVQKIDKGNLADNTIELEIIQDIFAINTVVFGTPENSGWVDARPYPELVEEYLIEEMPLFYRNRLDTPISSALTSVIPFAVSPKPTSNAFDLVTGTNFDVQDTFNPAAVFYPHSAKIVSAYDRIQGFETGLDDSLDAIIIQNLVGQDSKPLPQSSEAEIRNGTGGIIYMNGEFMSYVEATPNGDGTISLGNVRRGLFGTSWINHSAGSTIYFMNMDLLNSGAVEYLPEGTVYYKIVDRVGGTSYSAQLMIADQYQMPGRFKSASRPRMLSFEGSRSQVPGLVAPGTYNFSFIQSDINADEVLFEDDPETIPVDDEFWLVELWVDGEKDDDYDQTIVTKTFSVTFGGGIKSIYYDTDDVELRVYTKRIGDINQLNDYASYPLTFASQLEYSGDEQLNSEPGDTVLLSGDAQERGFDMIKISGDER